MILKMCEWVDLYEIIHQVYPYVHSFHILFPVLLKIDIFPVIFLCLTVKMECPMVRGGQRFSPGKYIIW